MVAPIPTDYSALVRLELRAGGDIFRLAQFGGDVLIFDRAVRLPGNTGEVVARIDDHEQRWAVTWEPSGLEQEVVRASFREIP